MTDIKTRLLDDYENWSLGSKGPAILSEAAATISSLEARIEELEGALKDFMDITEPAAKAARVDPNYGGEVERLGKQIGFGALISSASASWREHLKSFGYPAGGEFVVGPCMSVLRSCREKARSALNAKGE